MSVFTYIDDVVCDAMSFIYVCLYVRIDDACYRSKLLLLISALYIYICLWSVIQRYIYIDVVIDFYRCCLCVCTYIDDVIDFY